MKYLLLAFALLLALPSLAQTAKSTQYCLMEAEYRAKHKAELTLITGADPTTTGQSEEITQVASMAYEADALNYLSSHGWEVISTTTRTSATGASYATRYYLRRKP